MQSHGWKWWKWWRWSEPACRRKLAELFKSPGQKQIADLLLRQYYPLERTTPAHQYTVHYRHGASHDYDEEGIFWDAYLGLLLEVRGKTVAWLGFNAKSNRLVIKQVQGQKNCREELGGWRWEQFLVEVLIALAREMGYQYVYMVKGRYNFWYSRRLIASEPDKVTEEDQKQHAARIRDRYDRTASTLGFRGDVKKRYWVYPLGTG